MLRNFLLFLLAISLTVAIAVWLRFGGGERHRDLTTSPLIGGAVLEQVLQYPEPIGNVAVSEDGRIFFTIHPESRPQGNKLLEWVADAAVPYPNGTVQPHIFDSVLGLTIDHQQRLWTIDHGRQGFADARILAFDLSSGTLVHDHTFTDKVAPSGSFLQDLVISRDGTTVVISDGSIISKNPALVVYDIETRTARRLLQDHVSVSAENYLISHPIGDLSYFGGLFTLKCGVSGLTFDNNEEWLYYAATNQDGLFRIRTEHLFDPLLTDSDLAARVERFSDKPLSDGLLVGPSGRIFVTDIEHNAVSVIGSERVPLTVIRDPRIRWAAALSFGPDEYMYIADSALPELILQTRNHIRSKGPYSVYRFAMVPLEVSAP